MDTNTRKDLGFHGNQLSEALSIEKAASNPLFFNYAEIAWHERRRAWVSDKSRKPIQRLTKPLTTSCSLLTLRYSCSWNTKYEDDLVTSKLFSASIPLSDVVGILCKIWLDKGPPA